MWLPLADFSPARATPKLAITVIVDTPHGKGVGTEGLSPPGLSRSCHAFNPIPRHPSVDPESPRGPKTFHSSTL
jgi:hypothetical protein